MMKRIFKKNIGLAIILVIGLVGCEEILFEPDLKDENVVIVTPSTGAEIEQTTVNFDWEELLEATSYQLQVATPDFASATQVLVDSTMADTEFQKVLEAGAYEWRVRAIAGSSKSPYTTTNFSVVESEDFTARTVSLSSPGEDTATNQVTQMLSWTAVTDATLYTIQLLDANDEVLTAQTTGETSIVLDFPEGVITWQVRAEKGEETTTFAQRVLTVDLQVPNKAVQSAPVDESSTTATTINFEWTREAVAGTTEFDSIYIYQDEALQTLETKRRASSPAAIELTAATYYWQVRGFDVAGNEGEISEVFSFTIN